MIDTSYELIINLQGDLPIFKKELFEKMICLFEDKTVDIGSAVCKLDKCEINDTNVVKAQVNLDKKNTGIALNFSRNFNGNSNFYHHIGVYIYRHKVLEEFIKLKQTKNEIDRSLEQMRALDNNYKIKLTKVSYNPPSIDTPNDLRKIRLILKSKN